MTTEEQLAIAVKTLRRLADKEAMDAAAANLGRFGSAGAPLAYQDVQNYAARTLEKMGQIGSSVEERCAERVWANGDKESCGGKTLGGDLCPEHLAGRIHRFEEDTKALRASLRDREDELALLRARQR